MELREAIGEWRDFYAAVANAGAALVGLVFVGVSIHLGRRPLDAATRMLGVETYVNLLHPLLVALGMLLPVAPAVQGMGLLVLVVSEVASSIWVVVVQTRQSGQEPRLVLAYRYFIPVAATVVLATGALGLVAGWAGAVYAPPVFVFLMLIVGSQNAWDLLLGNRGRLG